MTPFCRVIHAPILTQDRENSMRVLPHCPQLRQRAGFFQTPAPEPLFTVSFFTASARLICSHSRNSS